jgi:flagellar motor switch protein FliG
VDHAAIIEENDKISLQKPPTAGRDIGVLKQMDDWGVQKTLRKIDAQTLTLALKTADEETKERVFLNMSENHARMLKEDLEYIGKVKRAEVLAAQNRIARVIDRLVLTGEIKFPDGDYV